MPKFGEQVVDSSEREATITENPSKEGNASVTESTQNNENQEDTQGTDNGYQGVDKYLAEFGYVDGVVPFEEEVEEDGKMVTKTIGRKFNELGDEEKYDVLKTLTDSTTKDKYELSEDESKLISTLREKEVSFEDLMNAEIEKEVSKVENYYESKSKDFDKMPDDVLFKMYLKDKYSEESDDEISERYSVEKDLEGYSKKVGMVRDSFKEQQELELKKIEDDLRKANDEQTDKDRKVIVNTVIPLDKVAGWRVSDTDKNVILEGLLEQDDNGNSKFINEIMSDPAKMFEAAYLYKFGNHLFNKQEDTFRKQMSVAIVKAKNDALGTSGVDTKRENFSVNQKREEDTTTKQEGPKKFGEQ